MEEQKLARLNDLEKSSLTVRKLGGGPGNEATRKGYCKQSKTGG